MGKYYISVYNSNTRQTIKDLFEYAQNPKVGPNAGWARRHKAYACIIVFQNSRVEKLHKSFKNL